MQKLYVTLELQKVYVVYTRRNYMTFTDLLINNAEQIRKTSGSRRK